VQVPAVQNYGKQKMVDYLQNKLHTKVQIAKLSISFPKKIVLNGVYFEDQRKDTLFSGGKMLVDIAMFKLLKGNLEISYLELKDIRANIYRTGTDTVFNYQYIVNAFSSSDTTTTTDTAGGMKINLRKIVLNNVGAVYKDDQSGIDFFAQLGKFETGFKELDPNKMIFSLPDIVLENVTGHMYQSKPLLVARPTAVVEAQSNEPFKLQLALKNIAIKNIQFDYKNDVSLMSAKLQLGELSGKVKSIDLAKLDVQLDNLKLHNTSAGVILGKSEQTRIVKKEVVKEVAAQANNPWKLSIGNIDFDNNNLAFDNNNEQRISTGMDYAHLDIRNFKLSGNSFAFTPTVYQGNITGGAFSEQSGFNLQQIKTDFAYSDTGAVLGNLYLQTDQTLIKDNIRVSYPSIDAVTKDMGKLYMDANFSNSKLAAKDILVFAPQLKPNLKGNENAVININARVIGYVNNLTIPTLQISGIGNTMASLSGTIKGLPNPDKTVYNLAIANLQTTKADLDKLLPPGIIPATVRLPQSMKLSGSFKGLATNFTTDLLLQTNKGTASLQGTLSSANETYNLKGRLNNVDVGYLTKQDTLVGKVTMDFAAKGSGFKPASMNVHANAQVKAAFVKGYNYQNLQLVASVNNGYTVIDAEMADKSLAFKLNGEALIDDKFATNIKLRLLLDSILLRPLGFATTDLRVHGDLNAAIATTDLNSPNGNIQLSDLVVYNDGSRYKADSISITASTTDTGKLITLNSQIATARLQGNYNPSTIGSGAMKVINRYYNLGIKDTAINNDHWNLNATIIPDSLLFAFVPSIAGSDTIYLKANFDGEAGKLNMLVNAPTLQLGTQALDSLTITAGNDGDHFLYAATVLKAGSKSFQLQHTKLDGFIANNELHTKLNVEDGDGKDKYQLGATVVQLKNGIKASLSDSLMLDYDKWSVDKSNYIQYDSTGILIHNFSINNNGQLLSFKSQTNEMNSPVDIVLKDFHLKTLTNLAEQDSLNLEGIVNGKVLVKNITSNPVFTSDIAIDSIMFNKDTIGNISVKVDNETANSFNADIAISGNGNDVKLLGKYFTGEGKMDLKLDVANLNLSSVRPFTFGALNYADGSLKGGVTIKGTTNNPEIVGGLHFENANIVPDATGEKLHLSNEAIVISSRDIEFDQFTLVDSAGNKAIINGKIFTTDFKTYSFGLNISADDFRVLNEPKKQNSIYYGHLNMDADISVNGPLTTPRINADLRVNKLSDITFVLPSTNPEVENRDGVVEFVDMYGSNTDKIFKAVIDSLTSYPKFAGLDLTGTLQSDTAAQITLIIDERSGDALRIRGKSDLAVALDKSGKISLTGNYELQAGSYQLSLSLLKRQFLIQPGSVITWTGDPMSATVGITAVYIANTQPVNLLQSELANSSTDINKYKAKIPFRVLLKMKGELLKPEISFDIELPDDQKSKWVDVETKLEQVRRDDAELNKQVFALLLLGRFVQENPLENSADGGGTLAALTGTAKSSVSRILAEQLNNLAGSLIKGVDLNFGVNTEDDYSSGTRTSRTDLTVGVSKKLLNDRLRINVGSNFELEGPANTNQNASNIAGDVAVDYLLSEDGKYALRGYRRNRYEGVVEGQIIESGISFIFTFDFNEFKQILNRKTEDQKRQEKAEKEREKTREKKQKKQENAAGEEKKSGT
jgi:hypothetical protein